MRDKANILLVEDEESLITGLTYNLREEGYEVIVARDGKEALETFSRSKFDLIILDIMLPYIDGFEVARQIRSKSPLIPILMLTARASVNDRVTGLDLGADDYLVKPFHLQELMARIRRILQRKEYYQKSPPDIDTYRFGSNIVDFDALSAQVNDKTIQLTPYEASLLKYLIRNRGKVISRRELLENVWHINSEIETRTVDIFIARLRKYFEKDPRNPQFILSHRGAGYMFKEN